jgi:hypothetical protein
MFMKPYDGGAWVGVSRIDDEQQLRAAYEKSGRRVMHLQKAILPFDLFVRALGVGPQVRIMKYDPSAPPTSGTRRRRTSSPRTRRGSSRT